MSELIDRIYDVQKISKEVADVVAGVEKSITAIDGFKKAVDELEKSTRKSKGTEELINNTKLLNDNVVKGGIEMKRYEAEVQKLKEKTEQLTNSEKAASIEIAKARLELQAANKATKEAAAEQVLLDAKTKGVKENYSLLKKELEASAIAYKNLTIAEQKTADGKALLAKYWELKKAVNGTDEALGNFQHKVGQYENALSNLPGIFGQMQSQGQAVLVSLRTKFESVKDATMSVRDAMAQSREAVAASMAAAEKAAIAEEALATAKKTGSATSVLAAEAEATRATATVAATAATEASSVAMKVFKYALISTGIGAIVVALGAMVAYFTKTNEGSKEFAKISAGINAVIQSGIKILGSYGKLLFAIATFDLKKIKEGWNEIGTNIKNATGEIKENYKAGVQNTANQQMMAKRERTWSGERLKLLKEFEDAKIMAGKRSALDDEGKAKAAKRALQINETIYQNDLKIAKNKAKMVEDEQKLVSKKDYQAIQDAKNKVQEIINAHSQQQLTVGNLLGKTEQRIEDGNKAAVKSEAEKNKEILEAKRKLFDMEVSLMADSEEKSLKISNEKFTREIEDSKATGILKQNILDAQEAAANKIKNEWSIKRLNDTIKADELTLENMKKSGQSTLEFEKQILQDRMQAEILAGGNVFDIKQKYKFLELDLEAKTADEKVALFEKQLSKESELLTNSYSEKELQLKREFSQSKQTADDKLKYENKLAKLKLDALLEVNDKTIESLEKELKVSGLSDDKKAELSNKLAKLKIDNENAVTDAVIKNNEEQVKSDDDAKAKRVEVAKALASAGAEIFGAIAEYEKQRSEEKIKEYEAELDANDLKFEKEQSNLDNAIMSDEMRAEKQNEINEKKFAADQVIQDKIKAEKVKQAKWEKANSIIQAIIGTGLAIISGLKNPFPLNLIAVGLATTLGAIQVATIASQPIPAFEKGGVTGDGLALWGEARPEVAVLPSGDVMLAEKPTITNFDAGTRIYKSIADYELAMGGKNGGSFEFDYDKMGEKMKAPTINLDSNGLWSIVSKQNERMTLVNRRYRLN